MGVRIRQKDGKWYVFINHQGKRKAKCVGDSKKAALEVKLKLEARLTLGDFDLLDDKPVMPTFQAYAEKWLATHARFNCKPRTYQRYQGALTNHLVPYIGSTVLSDIRKEQIRQLVFRLREHLSPASISLVLSMLGSILGQAVDDELITKNPAMRMSKILPKRQQQQIEALTREELAHLLVTIQTRHTRYYPLFLTLARTGMRVGEAIGLQWGDIDWHRHMIHIQRNAGRGEITTPKNGKTRLVDMSAQLTQTLQDWQTHCELEAIERGWDEMPPWVFTTKRGCSLDYNNFRSKVWLRCLTSAGFRHIGIHNLRHTYASLLLQQGESLAYIRDQLGHSSIKITVDTYGHLVPGGNRQAVDKLDDAPDCNLSATKDRYRIKTI